MKNEKVNLAYQDGGSDKVYNVELQDHGNGQWSVYTEYGRRGSTLQQGFKVQNTTYISARKAYDKVVNEKTGKGYKVVGGGTTPSSPQNAPQAPAMQVAKGEFEVQLLNAIDEDQLEKYLKDPSWGAMEKMDGERRPVAVNLNNNSLKATGFNRKNQEVMIPSGIAGDLLKLSAGTEMALDGEIIGEHLYLFDGMRIDGMNYTDESFLNRWKKLDDIMANSGVKNLSVVALAITEAEKRALFDRIKAEGGEGIVFKKLDAVYSPGRPNSGGPALKFKFVESATFIVTGVNNGKRSVSLSLIEKKGSTSQVDVGNVTVPANKSIPQPGECVEVLYLYAFKGGSIYQPVLKGVRNDIGTEDCLLSQLKYKKQVKADEAIVATEVNTESQAYAW